MLDKALQQAKASLEIDGYTLTEQHTSLVRAVLTTELTTEEFLDTVCELVGITAED